MGTNLANGTTDMTGLLTILHLSDLHFSRRRQVHDRQVIQAAFLADLKQQCGGAHAPDLVVFSGDLALAADEERVYDYLYDELLDQVSTITRCGDKRLIVVPGNHDADRETIKRKAGDQVAFLDGITDRSTANEAYLDGRLQQLVAQNFHAFEDLRGYLGGTPIFHDGIVTVYDYLELQTSVVVLNSAATTWGGLDGRDDTRRLIVPEAAIDCGLAAAGAGHLRLLVTHHPTSWFTEFSEADFQTVTDGKIAMHLFGHAHAQRPILTTHSTGGQIVVSQVGALHQARERYNGYSIIRYDRATGNAAVHIRSYFDGRREFGDGVDIVDGGISYFPSAARQFFYATGRQIDLSVFRVWLAEKLAPAAMAEYDEGLADRPVHEVFVPPPMSEPATVRPTDDVEAGVETREARQVTLAEVIDSDSNFVLRGGQEFGKTTLLQQIALGLLEQASSANGRLTVPSLIDFSGIRAGTNRIQRLVQSGLAATPEGMTVDQLLAEGLMTILVDDVVFSDRQRIKLLSDFITVHSKNRYIFTTLSNTPQVLHGQDVVEVANTPVTFRNVFLRPLGAHGLRTLVGKFDRDGLLDHEVVLKRILREFAGTNIPVTAVNSTIFLLIYNDLNDQVINRANLIEQFVEHLLEKRRPAEAVRSTFDFKNKTHVLAHIAKHMVDTDTYVLSQDELHDTVRSFLQQTGLAWDSLEIVRNFIDSRVLARKGDGRIRFRYRAFCEYFVAQRMLIDSQFRAYVLAEANYLRFLNEIQYYAGMSRVDADLVNLVGDRFAALTEAAQKLWPIDLHKLDAFRLPAGSSDNLIEQFEVQMEALPLTAEERDAHLQADLPQDAEHRQEVFRPVLTEEQRWIVALLLYSGIVKNLDMIDDTCKRRHLDAIFTGWGHLTAISLAIVPLLAKQRQMTVNGVNYAVLLPHHFSEAEVAAHLYVDLPQSISRLILSFLGTEKLQRQLLEPDLQTTPPPAVARYYRDIMAADLRLGDWISNLSMFANSLGDAPYIQELLMRKIADTYLMGDYPESSAPRLKRLFADTIAALRGAGRKHRTEIRAKAIQRLERAHVLQRLRLAPGTE